MFDTEAKRDKAWETCALRHHLSFKGRSNTVPMLHGYYLPRPSAVVTGRSITRSNAGCLDTPANRHSRRLHLVICEAGGKPSESDSAQQDVRARIAAARQYRDRVGPQAASGGEATELQSEAAGATTESSDDVQASSAGRSGQNDAGEDRLHDAVVNYGDVWADKLEGQFTAAREQLTSRAATSSTASAPAAAEPSLADLDLAIERLSKRKPAALDSAAAGTQPAASASTSGAGEFRSDRGSATKAAGFLAGMSARSPPGPAAPDERPEDFTARKFEEQRQTAEIITIEKDYAPSSGQYRPKVATWGVFERPANISKAFGGGRNLRPGGVLEDENATAERKRRVALALSKYKKTAGLEIDAQAEQRAEELFQEGMALFDRGQLQPSLLKFEAAEGMVGLRSRVGGVARLQKAIVLDSVGRSSEAKELYTALKGHPHGDLAKRARRLLFGFQAMDNLKAHTMSYAPSKGAYESYFRRIESRYSNVYFAPTAEKKTLLPELLATSVMFGPLLAAAYVVLRK